MKKFLLGTMMLLAAGTSFAQTDYLTITPKDGALKAGAETEITVGIVAQNYDWYSGMEVLIKMPEGLDLAAIDSTYDRRSQTWSYTYIKPLETILAEKFSITSKWVPVGDDSKESGLNELRIIVVSMDGKVFPYNDKVNENLFAFKVKASDKMQTGAVPVTLTALASHPVEGGSEGVDFAVSAEYQYSIDFEIGSTGYATLSWPVALDFSKNTDFEANIVTDVVNSNMILSKVTKAPAGTGLVIVGKPGNYSLTTTAEDVAKVDNILESTANGAYKVAGAQVYALANKSAGIGFYKVNEGVEIPKYRAYYTASTGADAFFFENTDGISQVEAQGTEADVYSVSGVKMQNAKQKGIYIVNGKKVVVK